MEDQKNGSYESGLGNHPLNRGSGLIFGRLEFSGATERRFLLELVYRIWDELFDKRILYRKDLIRTTKLRRWI